MTLESIRYRDGSLQILNQLLLPHQTSYDNILTVQDAYEAIKSMKVRGHLLLIIIVPVLLVAYRGAALLQYVRCACACNRPVFVLLLLPLPACGLVDTPFVGLQNPFGWAEQQHLLKPSHNWGSATHELFRHGYQSVQCAFRFHFSS